MENFSNDEKVDIKDNLQSNIGCDLSYIGQDDFEKLQNQIKINERQTLNNLYKSENNRKRGLLFYVGLIYAFVLLALIGVRLLSNMGVFGGLGVIARDFVTSGIIQILIMFSLPVFGFCLVKKQKVKATLKDFQFTKISGKIVLIAVIIGFLVFFLNGFISTIFAYIISALGYEATPTSTVSQNASIWYFLTTVVCSCILPAICEETAHRGLLLNGIKRYGVGKAIIISGLLFGLIHLNINQFFYATIIGFVIGVITVYSGSIYPAMIVHFMNNFLSTCSEFAMAYGIDFLNINSIISYINSLFGVIIANMFIFGFIIVCVLLLFYLIYKLYANQKFDFVFNKIKKDNIAYFYNANNLDENGNLKTGAVNEFFGGVNKEQATLIYLSNNNKKVPFWDNFDTTYLKEDRKGLLNWTFIIGAMVTASLVTIFTFVWGLL